MHLYPHGLFSPARAGVAAALALPAPLRGDPYRPWSPARPGPVRPVRIRGRVLAAGRGVPRAGISDGIQVVSTRLGRLVRAGE